MGTIKLDGQNDCLVTLVSNKFLDEYMPGANGEFVKIYLYLLRAMGNPSADISVCKIADIFNHTEKDVIRALKYWEQIGLLDLGFNDSNTLTNIKFKGENTASDTAANHSNTNSAARENTSDSISKDTDINSPAPSKEAVKKIYTANEVDTLCSKTDIQEILYLAQKYMGKTLSRTDMNSILYFYDGLGFSADLIEYLIEYCVSNKHNSIRYMEKVALTWAEEGINTVELAKASTDTYNQTCYPVLKAFGISGRNPGRDEKSFIIKWTNSYGFTMDIIVEACNRTLNNTGKQSFKYADSILTDWHNKGAKNLSDIKNLDNIYFAESKKNANSTPAKTDSVKTKNSFNNFDQRDIDYAALERELLNND